MADTLETLLRLRHQAVDASRRALAAALATEATAETELNARRMAIETEADLASSVLTGDEAVEAYAAWLPRGRAALARAEAAHGAANAVVAQCRAALTHARANARTAEELLAQRKEAARMASERRDQAALDEAALRLARLSNPELSAEN
jgi:flagellar export protein FliJ